MNEEIQEIIDHCFEVAVEQLTNTGELYPFGAFVSDTGRLQMLDTEIDRNKVPNNGELMKSLLIRCEEAFTEGSMNAYGIAYEVNVKLDATTSTDAVAIDIVHKEEKSVPVFYFPFTMDGRELKEFGDSFAVKR